MPPKRNVAFIKPEEPAFLKRMKAQIGFTEPDTTIDTKREAIDNFSDDDDDGVEKDDERPQVVQLKEGDLTAEEAFVMEKVEAEKPADLSQRVIFKPKKSSKTEDNEKKDESSASKSSKSNSSKKDKKKSTKNLLSFQDEDEEEF